MSAAASYRQYLQELEEKRGWFHSLCFVAWSFALYKIFHSPTLSPVHVLQLFVKQKCHVFVTDPMSLIRAKLMVNCRQDSNEEVGCCTLAC